MLAPSVKMVQHAAALRTAVDVVALTEEAVCPPMDIIGGSAAGRPAIRQKLVATPSWAKTIRESSLRDAKVLALVVQLPNFLPPSGPVPRSPRFAHLVGD